jgi:hypothetical protein
MKGKSYPQGIEEATATKGEQSLHTPKDLAEQLKVTQNALSIWRHNGTGPNFLRISRRAIRYTDDAVQKWLKEKEVC